MKRPKDVQRPNAPAEKRITGDGPTQIKHAASREDDTGVTTRLRALQSRPEPASPVEAAAALIELALQESNSPVEDLGGALTRLALLAAPKPGDSSNAEAKLRAQVAREVAICIESLQFHDRLTQQLTQVRNLLATLVLKGDQHNWLLLLENLRARFTSDSHRVLFNLLLPGGAPGRSSVPGALHANEGSVELF